MAFTTQADYLEAKKLFETFDVRANNNVLSVDAANQARLSTQIRVERNALLRATDFTQLADSTPDSNDWLSYRQALRDIPNQAGFPYDVTFPAVPEPDVVAFQAYQFAGDGTTYSYSSELPG